MSEKKIGFFGETPVLESELVDATARDLFDKVRRLGEERDACAGRARQAEAERDEWRGKAEHLDREATAIHLSEQRLKRQAERNDEETIRLRTAADPVAEWFVAMLGAHLNDQQGFRPDDAVLFSTNDVKLTARQARALVTACGLAEALKGAE